MIRLREVEKARAIERQREREHTHRRKARRRAALVQRNPDQIAADRRRLLPSGTATCRGCGQAKPFSDFADSLSNPTGLHPYCHDCDNRGPCADRAAKKENNA